MNDGGDDGPDPLPDGKWRFGTLIGNAALMNISPRDFDQMTVYEHAFVTQAYRKAYNVDTPSAAPTDDEFFKRIGAL